MAGSQGLGSDNMSDEKKREIQSKGGQTTGASNLSHEDRVKGGKKGGRRSSRGRNRIE